MLAAGVAQKKDVGQRLRDEYLRRPLISISAHIVSSRRKHVYFHARGETSVVPSAVVCACVWDNC